MQTDIDEIIDLHEKFLAKIVKNCLLQNKHFQQSFHKVFNFILQFCDMWRRGIHYFTESIRESVIELEKNIDIYFEFIFKILSVIVNRNQSIHFQILIAVLNKSNI